MPFKYFSAFSMLNETRKRQFVDILSKGNHIPVYYPEDAEVYLRAGRLPSGEILAAAFNLSQDELEELPLTVNFEVKNVEILNEKGERVGCDFEKKGGVIYIKQQVVAMSPIVVFLA